MTEGFAVMDDGCRLGWREDGDPGAPPLLLANSLGTTIGMWAPQMAALSQRFRVIRYDSRGHGRSSAPAGDYSLDRLGRDALALLDGLSIARADFCGLSLGGMIGQWLGVHAGERLNRLVIANSSPYMGPPSAWRDRIALIREAGVTSVVDAVAERWFTPEFRSASPETVETICAMLRATPVDGYCGCCAAIAAMDMRPVLSRISAPTLVIGGLRDPATPPEHARALAAGIAGARLVELPAAHLSNVEMPDAFTGALSAFLT